MRSDEDKARFIVLQDLGRGGYGELSKARRGDHVFCVKRLHPVFAHRKDLEERLLAEAATLASISHPNVVGFERVHRVDGEVCLEMEYVAGVSLRAFWRAAVQHNAATLAMVAQVAQEVLAGLSALHNRDASPALVHGDICLQNLLIAIDGGVKIIDFGSVQRVDIDAKLSAQQSYHRGYGAPERALGVVHTGADIYAVGVVVERLIGELQSSSQTGTEGYKALRVIARRACQADPKLRYNSAGEMRGVLQSYLDTLPAACTSDQMARVMTELFPELLDDSRLTR